MKKWSTNVWKKEKPFFRIHFIKLIRANLKKGKATEEFTKISQVGRKVIRTFTKL